ncbi:NYN domain-containing protein, partial [Variovorax sp. CT11-76]
FVLRAVPALRAGTDVPLNEVAKALREAGLLGKNGSSLKLFDKLTAEFRHTQHPDRIRWTGADAA